MATRLAPQIQVFVHAYYLPLVPSLHCQITYYNSSCICKSTAAKLIDCYVAKFCRLKAVL